VNVVYIVTDYGLPGPAIYQAIEVGADRRPTRRAWRWNTQVDSGWVETDGASAVDDWWLDPWWVETDDPPAALPAAALRAR
jgi:hypothetical protein